MRRLSAAAISLLFALLLGCSYGMDMLDRALTNRANFSISGSYSGGNVTLDWSSAPWRDHFAGYELYMTRYPDNPESDYEVIAAGYDINTSHASGANFTEDASLRSIITKSFAFPVTGATAGRYYFRVALITIDDYKDENGNTVYYTVDDDFSYSSYTSVSDASGYISLDIP